MDYQIKQILTFNNQDYQMGDFVEVTYLQFAVTETKLKGRIAGFETIINSSPYILFDISEKYQSNKEYIYLDNLISIERIKKNE